MVVFFDSHIFIHSNVLLDRAVTLQIYVCVPLIARACIISNIVVGFDFFTTYPNDVPKYVALEMGQYIQCIHRCNHFNTFHGQLLLDLKVPGGTFKSNIWYHALQSVVPKSQTEKNLRIYYLINIF